MLWKPMSFSERRDRVTELRAEAKKLLDEADRIQVGLDKDEEEMWRLALKAKELHTSSESVK